MPFYSQVFPGDWQLVRCKGYDVLEAQVCPLLLLATRWKLCVEEAEQQEWGTWALKVTLVKPLPCCLILLLGDLHMTFVNLKIKRPFKVRGSPSQFGSVIECQPMD